MSVDNFQDYSGIEKKRVNSQTTPEEQMLMQKKSNIFKLRFQERDTLDDKAAMMHAQDKILKAQWKEILKTISSVVEQKYMEE